VAERGFDSKTGSQQLSAAAQGHIATQAGILGFVTHIHPTVDGCCGNGQLLTTVLDRDPLLACQPASVHTVLQDDDDDDDDDD
jgi:hypothetical protein